LRVETNTESEVVGSIEEYNDMKKLRLMKILRERNVDYSDAKDVNELR
jgi:hypothetical protein